MKLYFFTYDRKVVTTLNFEVDFVSWVVKFQKFWTFIVREWIESCAHFFSLFAKVWHFSFSNSRRFSSIWKKVETIPIRRVESTIDMVLVVVHFSTVAALLVHFLRDKFSSSKRKVWFRIWNFYTLGSLSAV